MRTTLIAALLCAAGLAFTCGCNPKADAARKRFVETKAKAEQGDATAQRNLAYYYGYGEGVKTDTTEAVKWWRKAAEQNHAEAQYGLASCYESGRGVVKDYAEAAKWYRKAAEQNNSSAKEKLADFYANGQGVAKDPVEAYAWYGLQSKGAKRAANSRDILAKQMSPQQLAEGKKRTEELREQFVAQPLRAKYLAYKSKAEQGDAGAQNDLASCYLKGKGVETNSSQAVKWFLKAAEQNHAQAQFNLGDYHYRGKVGAPDYLESLTQAVMWFRKAAEQQHPDAQYYLGYASHNGQGVAKHYPEAVKWFRKAAEQNHGEAQYYLGNYYALGQGVEKDIVEAHAWASLATTRGSGLANKNRNDLAKVMSPQQVAAAQKRAEELRAQIASRLKSGGK